MGSSSSLRFLIADNLTKLLSTIKIEVTEDSNENEPHNSTDDQSTKRLLEVSHLSMLLFSQKHNEFLKTDVLPDDLKIIYPNIPTKATMESAYTEGTWFVKFDSRVRFGFSLAEKKKTEIKEKGLEVCLGVCILDPLHHQSLKVNKAE